MKISYSLVQQFIARILLVSLFLQSCSNFTNSPIPPLEETTDHSQELTKQVATNELLDQKFIASGGHIVTFHEETGDLQAEVEENLPTGFSKSHRLPVYIAEDISLSEVAHLNQAGQKSLIEVKLSAVGQAGYVYVGKRGLQGGMQVGDVTGEQRSGQATPQLIDYIELRRYFNKGNLEITPVNYSKLADPKYSEALAAFDKGVIVKGWKASLGFEPLEDILLAFNHIRSLKIQIVWDQEGHAVEIVSRSVQFYKELEELDVSGCDLDNQGLQEIVESLPAPENLKFLNIEGNNSLNLAGLKVSLPRLSNLQTLKSSIAEAQEMLIKKQASAMPSVKTIQKDLKRLSVFTPSVKTQDIDIKEDQLPPVLQIKALTGAAEDEYELGLAFYQGDGIHQDYDQAFAWYKKAALQDHLEAQINIKTMFIKGEGFFQESAEVLTAMKLAAKKRDPLAYMVLGWIYKYGKGTSVDHKEAFKWHKKAARKKLTLSQYEMGVSYAEGQGVNKNETKACKWYKRATQKGCKDAEKRLNELKKQQVASKRKTVSQAISSDQQQQALQAEAEIRRRITRVAPPISAEAERQYELGKRAYGNAEIEHFKKAAELGHPAAKYKLAEKYESGFNVPKDFNKALQLYQEAAEIGNVEAQDNLGNIYYTGKGTKHSSEGSIPKDLVKAKVFWEEASERGYARAQKSLADLYRNGEGVEKDLAKAKELYLQAAAQAHPDAQRILKALAFDLKDLEVLARKGNAQAQYELSLSSPSYKEIKYLNWLEMAARQGHMDAQFKLGRAYVYGSSVVQNYIKAKEWYEKAARQGHAEAYLALSELYYSGKEGINKDEAKAAEYILKSAELGYFISQSRVADHYECGERGFPKNEVKAKEMRAKAEASTNMAIAKEEESEAYFQAELDKFRKSNGSKVTQQQTKVAAQRSTGLSSIKQKPAVDMQSTSASKPQSIQRAPQATPVISKTKVCQPHASVTISQEKEEAWFKEGEAYFKNEDYANARKSWEKAANYDHSGAKQRLGHLYFKGLGVQRNIDRAVGLWKEAAAEGNIEAKQSLKLLTKFEKESVKINVEVDREIPQYSIVRESAEDLFKRGYEFYRKKDYVKAREWYEKAAENGNKEAQYYFGLLYNSGCGVRKSYELAFKWLMKSAQQNHVAAQFMVGCYYYKEWGEIQDYVKATEWFEQAAAQGYVPAQEKLQELNKEIERGSTVQSQSIRPISTKQKSVSSAYNRPQPTRSQPMSSMVGNLFVEESKPQLSATVRSVSEDAEALYQRAGSLYNNRKWKDALDCYERAANQGHAGAQMSLASEYSNGFSVNGITIAVKDEQRAFYWFKRAADQGHVSANTFVGSSYRDGRGVEQDYSKALAYYLVSADKNDVLALNALGDMYCYGHGVQQNYSQAKEWYKKAAAQGYDTAQTNLGAAYYRGQGVQQSYIKAKGWFEKAANQGQAEAQNWLGFLYYNGQGVTQDYTKAKEWYEKAAAQGNAVAKTSLVNTNAEIAKAQSPQGQYTCGMQFYNSKDYAKAKEWFEKAATQGNVDAQRALGLIYHQGECVSKNYVEAFKWFMKAAQQGHATAQCDVGNYYCYALGVSQDYTKAREWWEKAAAQGQVDAQNELGLLYYNGEGVAKDFYQARRWWEKAANQGKADAQSWLGYLYDHGQGGREDIKLSVYWYEKAVAQGHSKAQSNLGLMYQTGRGVRQDSAKALELYEKSASQGFMVGSYHLGIMYENGEVVNKDLIKAKEWYEKAAAQGLKEAQVKVQQLEQTINRLPGQPVQGFRPLQLQHRRPQVIYVNQQQVRAPDPFGNAVRMVNASSRFMEATSNAMDSAGNFMGAAGGFMDATNNFFG